MNWIELAPTIGGAFLASLVECVEAATIVLAVGTVRGWRSALSGAFAGLAALVVLVAALGPALSSLPERALQLGVGLLLLLFGMRWLRKAILRTAGIIPLHDEEKAFAAETDLLKRQAADRRANLLAGAAAFKAVLLEGLEVVFIVIAVGAGRGLTGYASIGAAVACLLVLAIGALVHRPLARVPENALKFAVGIMLTTFGIFWTGEGLGAPWPGEDAALVVIAALFGIVALGVVRLLRGRIAAREAALPR